MEDYEQYMDERGHEACAQMLARNSAMDGAAGMPVFRISEDGTCASIARKVAEIGQAAFDKELRSMGYVRIGNGEGGGMESITAKLREQADRIDFWAARQSENGFSPISINMRSEVDRIDGHISELKEENAKLRELLRDLWASCPVYEVDCAECRHAKADNSGEWVRYDCVIYDRMRELGVEA